MNFWQKLEKYPPVLVRLLARTPDGHALTDEQISATIDPALVAWLSVKTNWNDVPIQHIKGFLFACRADLTDHRWVRLNNRYTSANSKAKFTHLVNSPDWPAYRKLLAIYAKYLTVKT